MTEIFVALGSNLGDRLQQLGAALDGLAREPGFALRRWSRAYDTEPLIQPGSDPQPRYLNAVAQLGCLLAPREALKRLIAIEEQLGRVRREKWGPRLIDLDLILFGERTVHEPGLTVPHPGLAARSFVLVPLCELAPDALVPGVGRAADLLAQRPEAERAAVRPYRALRRPLPPLDEEAPEPGTGEPPPA